VLYGYFDLGIEVSQFWKLAMLGVGVIFVINSVDSLVRLYTDNLGITVAKLGLGRFIALNVGLLTALVLLFKFTPFEIQWVGLVVIGLYAVTLGLLVYRHRPALRSIGASR
jgi:glycine betaine transporter